MYVKYYGAVTAPVAAPVDAPVPAPVAAGGTGAVNCYNITTNDLIDYKNKLDNITKLNNMLSDIDRVSLTDVSNLVNSVNICSDTSCNTKFAKSVLTSGKCTCPSGYYINNNSCVPVADTKKVVTDIKNDITSFVNNKLYTPSLN